MPYDHETRKVFKLPRFIVAEVTLLDPYMLNLIVFLQNLTLLYELNCHVQTTTLSKKLRISRPFGLLLNYVLPFAIFSRALHTPHRKTILKIF